MTLTQLKYIVAVDKYRHFATAADKSYVTQPTLSMQIHKLEDELGVVLFDRSKSPVVPTEIGEKVLEQARVILQDARKVTDIVQFQETTLSGTFRVGVIPTVAPYLVPRFLHSFLSEYPDVELVFEESLTATILDGLENDELDAGIIATPVKAAHIYTESLYVEPFAGYLSKSHPLVEKDMLSVDDLKQTNIWLLNEGHCFRDQTVKICKEATRARGSEIEFRSGNLETLKKLVEQNYGMTLLPWTATQHFDGNCSNAVLKEFSDPVPCRKVRLAYGRKHLKQSIIKAFRESILQSIPENLLDTDQKMVIE
ncbi:hydrogen peroxide-inducible genes activator [soil metagenome]